MRYCFGEFELDEDGRELRRRGESGTSRASRVEAPPKVLAFLRTLVRSAPSVVTRSELIEAVWQGHVVSPSALNTVVKSLRQILDDGDQRFVRTVHGIGYVFVMAVERRRSDRPSALSDARQQLFVGRDAELARLASWFAEPSRSDGPRLFWVHGVGGIGKSTLLHRLEVLALENDVPMVTTSCGHLRPSPEALLQAIATSCGVETPSALPGALAARSAGLLALDGYETMRGLDDWVRERFVQMLPPGWRLLLSGRSAPGMRWRVDPTWTHAEEIALGDLSPPDAEALLERRGVAASERAPIVRFAGGHPLALVLATDSLRRTGRFPDSTAADADGVAAALIDSFVREATSKRHREALDCIAVMDGLDEDFLAAMLGDDAPATECFEWLSTLAMAERHPAGLTLHDLVRAALMANLWQNPSRLGSLVERAYTKLFADLEAAGSVDRRRPLVTSLWRLLALHPVLTSVMSVPRLSGTASLADLDAIAEHVRRFEGADSAAALRFWLTRDAACASVIRDDEGTMLGYAVLVKVSADDDEARASDPVLAVLDTMLEEKVRYSAVRWFADCRAYHDVTPVSVGCHVLTAERELSLLDELGWHFVLVSNPEAWMPLVRLADFGSRLTATTATIAAPRLTAFGHDMRERSLLEWFRAFARRIMDTLTTGASLDIGLG